MDAEFRPGNEGIALLAELTAHRLPDTRNTGLCERTQWNDQRLVWVPFHFLPGGEGDSFSERLVCQPNSAPARQMVQHALGRVTEAFGRELLGIAAHVYEDTFYYGFSGVSSRRNRIVPGSVECSPRGVDRVFAPNLIATAKDELAILLANWRTPLAAVMNGLGVLGHGAVDVCPDQPFLSWRLVYAGFEDRPEHEDPRRNADTFNEAAKYIYDMFSSACRTAGAGLADDAGPRPYAEIASAVEALIAVQGDKDVRAKAWRAAAREGKLFNGAEGIPDYGEREMAQSRENMCLETGDSDVSNEPAFLFNQAAGIHKWWVLRQLLPRYGIALA